MNGLVPQLGSCEWQERREKEVLRTAHPCTPFSGKCSPPPDSMVHQWCCSRDSDKDIKKGLTGVDYSMKRRKMLNKNDYSANYLVFCTMYHSMFDDLVQSITDV